MTVWWDTRLISFSTNSRFTFLTISFGLSALGAYEIPSLISYEFCNQGLILSFVVGVEEFHLKGEEDVSIDRSIRYNFSSTSPMGG